MSVGARPRAEVGGRLLRLVLRLVTTCAPSLALDTNYLNRHRVRATLVTIEGGARLRCSNASSLLALAAKASALADAAIARTVRALSAPPSCPCGRPCPTLNATASASWPNVPVLVIASSARCFTRARTQAAAAGLVRADVDVRWFSSQFINASHIEAVCCKGGRCGKGRRAKPGYRASIDGGVRAHRAVWADVSRSGVPSIVLKDDVQFVGASLDDVRFAVDRCRATNCSLAYLGTGTDLLLSHAYYLTPRAADTLLRLSHPWCNRHKQDYAMRQLCTSANEREPKATTNTVAGPTGAETCHAPPRGHYHASAKFSLGWGLFTQNHSAVPSYYGIARGRGGANFTAASAEKFGTARCMSR